MGDLRKRLPMVLSLAALVVAVVALILAIGACRQPAAEVVVVDEAGRVRIRCGPLGNPLDLRYGIALYGEAGHERAALTMRQDHCEGARLTLGRYDRPGMSWVTLDSAFDPVLSFMDRRGRQRNITIDGSVTLPAED